MPSAGSEILVSHPSPQRLQVRMSGAVGESEVQNVREFPLARRSDAQLVAEVAAGNAQAVSVVWKRYSSHVRSVILGNLGSDPNLDDLIQEVFISFVRNAGSIREPDRLRSYLIGAAIRQSRQNVRTKSRKRKTLDAYTREAGPTRTSPVVSEREGLRRLQGILDALPERLRESFVLRFVSGISTQEVAVARGVSLATAKRDVARAQERVLEHAKRDSFLSDYLRGTSSNSDPIPGGPSSSRSGDPT